MPLSPHSRSQHMAPDQRSPENLPDPWLFDTAALIRELDRCRELTNQIPITDANATHLGIKIAVDAQWNLRETIRHLSQLHSEGQQQWQRRADKALSKRQTHNPRRPSCSTNSQCKLRTLTAGCTSTDGL